MTDDQSFGGRWQVVGELGKGGQGTVYKVQDTKGTIGTPDLKMKVTIKILG